jgi:hypothetical protein
MTTPAFSTAGPLMPAEPPNRRTSDTRQRGVDEQSATELAARTWADSVLADSGTSPILPAAGPSTLPVAESVGPSLQDALYSPTIDLRDIGRETWLLGGVQSWEGQILEIEDGIFTAELTSREADSGSERLRAEFRVDALDTSDRASLAVGDLFYVTSMRVRDRGVLRTKYSLQLRRAGKWTDSDIEAIRSRVRQRLEALGDDSPQ